MNLNLVIDTSKFKPFEYYTAAVQTMKDYGATLQRYEDILNKIAEEKGEYVLPDSSQYKPVMDKYNQDYDTISSDFGKSTMNTQVLLDIKNIRKRYHSEISPIRKMVENYNKNIDKIAALGPDAIISNRNLLTNVDTYYGGVNPVLDYRSGKEIELDSMRHFSGINNALTQDPKFEKILNELYYLLAEKGGIDGKTALEAALIKYNNVTGGLHSEAVLNLLGHMLHVMDSLGVENFSEDAKKRVWDKIASGLVASLSAPKYSNVVNRDHETPSDRRQIAYQEAQMAKSGYIYNPSTGKYEYDEEAATTAGGTVQTATLPDGSTWNYDPKKKQWTSPDATWDGVPRTSEQLIKERDKLIAYQDKKELEANKEELEKSEEDYLKMGEKFRPLNYRGLNYKSNWKYDEDDGGFNGYWYSKFWAANKKLSDDKKNNIDPKIKSDIIRRALEQNPKIKWEDLDIWVDLDAFSNNHYRVVIKGTGERGNYIESEATTTNTTERAEQLPGNSTVVREVPRALQ